MKELLTVVTRKGQITVPVAIRRSLGLKEGDKVSLTLEHDNGVRLTRAVGVVARTAGMMNPHRKPLDSSGLREAAEQAIADDAAERAAG
jgi:AbrB family looped-hinge helix DNA binding protein